MTKPLSILLTLILSAPMVSATDLAHVEGTVSMQGQGQEGVEVRLLDLSSGRVTTVHSDAAGAFKAPVPAGVYALEPGRGYEIASGPRMVSAAPGQIVAAALQVTTAAPTTGSGLDLNHEPKGCMMADEHPEIDAAVRPAVRVKQARVYFKAAREREFHYVEMNAEIGRYVACLPEPKKDAGPVDYYVEAVANDGSPSRTDHVSSMVIKQTNDCPKDRKVAAVCPSRVPVEVFNLAGAPAFPSAFGGIVGASTIGATTTASLITIGASIIGVGLQLPGNGPASPSR